MKLLLWTIITSILAGSTLGARILSVLLMPSKSHGILSEGILRELGNRGHHITYITSSPPLKGPIPNMTLIAIKNIHELLLESMGNSKDNNISMLDLKDSSPWSNFLFSFFTGPVMSDHILGQPSVKAVINSNEKFDLVLGEVFNDESMLGGFSYKFKAPLVGIMSTIPNIWAEYLTGNPSPTSYIPHGELGYLSKMTFFQRFYNFILQNSWKIFHPLVYLAKQDTVMRKHFGDDLPRIHDILLNTSLVLINHHHSLAYPRPYLPNMVEVGGMHVGKMKPLPQDLQKYMDDSTRGVVLFSLGTNVKSTDMSSEKITAILQAFKRVPYNVIWKFENDKLDNLPSNVMIRKWLPQSDILGHPNIKLFITHGGLLSTTESVMRGVPILGIPIFGDQHLNMRKTQQLQLGLSLDYDEITEDLLYNTIMELTTNPKYSEAAKHTSAVLNDNPMPPLETVVWWVEYVLRHKGAPHLRSSVQHLAWYEQAQLDVIAFITIVLFTAIVVVKKVLKLTLRLLCSKKKSKVE